MANSNARLPPAATERTRLACATRCIAFSECLKPAATVKRTFTIQSLDNPSS
jgi:hypothetical protein